MSRINIAEVALSTEGFLLVRPALSDGADYQFIYRAANGIRWAPDLRALRPYELGSSSPAFWFERIVEAVKNEYGDELVLSEATSWKGIPPDLRAEIEQ